MLYFIMFAIVVLLLENVTLGKQLKETFVGFFFPWCTARGKECRNEIFWQTRKVLKE